MYSRKPYFTKINLFFHNTTRHRRKSQIDGKDFSLQILFFLKVKTYLCALQTIRNVGLGSPNYESSSGVD